jgi:hypothetical protein
MNLLVPAALGSLALAGPLIVLYMLRSRRRRVPVSSVLLWSRVEQNVTSAVPWKRLDLSALLVLQLVLLGLFALSLARPFFTEPTVLGPHTVVVLDASGSMAQARRFDDAVEAVDRLAADVSESKAMSVILAGPEARVVTAFARDPDTVRAALSTLEPTGGEADLSEAIQLARGLATPDRPTNIVLMSDGGSRTLAEEPVLGAVHLVFGKSEPNTGVQAFGVDELAGGGTRAFLSVANHGPETATADFDVAIDGVPAAAIRLEVPAGSVAERSFPLDAAPGSVIEVSRRGAADGLALDDRAWFVMSDPVVHTVSVSGEGSPFLAALIRIAPGFEAVENGPSDVVIVDRGEGQAGAGSPVWLIRPDVPPEGVEVVGLVENAVATFQAPGEPLLDDVDLSELAVAEAQVVAAPGWFTIVRAGDVPLILLGEFDDRRAVYFTFDLTHSNLPVMSAFPILGARILDWLAGAGTSAVETAPAGTPIPLATPAGATPEIELPDGTTASPSPEAALFGSTGDPGVYRVRYRAEDGSIIAGPVVVRAFVTEEAAALPREISTAPQGAEESDAARIVREFAPPFMLVVLALMLIEWWVGHQRPVPERGMA